MERYDLPPNRPLPAYSAPTPSHANNSYPPIQPPQLLLQRPPQGPVRFNSGTATPFAQHHQHHQQQQQQQQFAPPGHQHQNPFLPQRPPGPPGWFGTLTGAMGGLRTRFTLGRRPSAAAPASPGPRFPVTEAKSVDQRHVVRKFSIVRGALSAPAQKGEDGDEQKGFFKRRRSEKKSSGSWWFFLSHFLTCCCPSPLLSALGKKDKAIQQAFREKIALCILIFMVMCSVGFLTFGFNQTVCAVPEDRFKIDRVLGLFNVSAFSIRGFVHESNLRHPGVINITSGMGKDLSFMFPKNIDSHACRVNFGQKFQPLPCTVPGISLDDGNLCHNTQRVRFQFNSFAKYKGLLFVSWDDIAAKGVQNNYTVWNGYVWDLTRLEELRSSLTFIDDRVFTMVKNHIGKDATIAFQRMSRQREAECLNDIFQIAFVDTTSLGCMASSVLLYVSLAVIIGVTAVRFIFALVFRAFMSRKLSSPGARTAEEMKRRREERALIRHGTLRPGQQRPLELQVVKTGTAALPDVITSAGPSRKTPHFEDLSAPNELDNDPTMKDPSRMHCMVMVPCYSEDQASMRKTLDSIAKSYYPATHKVIVCIADGIVTGNGNPKPTSELLVDMMEIDARFNYEDPRLGNHPEAYPYRAIGEGPMEQNNARVYAGWYRYSEESDERSDHLRSNSEKKNMFGFGKSEKGGDSEDGPATLNRMGTLRARKQGKVPMIVIVKTGTEEERAAKAPKPGNRGKRDSQVLLMSFLAKLMFDEAMTELEFDLFYKLWTMTGVHPDKYEGVMMIDADTEIYADSLTHMVAVLKEDPCIMGLCGETRIANEWDSWVTMIQVFEYFISHHLSKAFESMFGGVTCLPGCFSMYRIKAPSTIRPGYWVPILSNPDIVDEYSENVVDTLHKKNLLLLGEDRCLTTLMLRTFPKRKMVFVPMAVCETVVPNTFKVLLSQRRRWINSTVHNLLELLLVKDLCGRFCFSMQFVIFMELIGTVVLPAAMCFGLFMIVYYPFAPANAKPLIPLITQFAMLGLPGVFIVITAQHPIFLFWMLIYICSIPVWNFVLPLYSFWNFDDFSWGQTRQVAEASKTLKRGGGHGAPIEGMESSGESEFVMMRWGEWMGQRKKRAEEVERSSGGLPSFAMAVAGGPPPAGLQIGGPSKLPMGPGPMMNGPPPPWMGPMGPPPPMGPGPMNGPPPMMGGPPPMGPPQMNGPPPMIGGPPPMGPPQMSGPPPMNNSPSIGPPPMMGSPLGPPPPHMMNSPHGTSPLSSTSTPMFAPAPTPARQTLAIFDSPPIGTPSMPPVAYGSPSMNAPMSDATAYSGGPIMKAAPPQPGARSSPRVRSVAPPRADLGRSNSVSSRAADLGRSDSSSSRSHGDM
ncbi:chitin synthase-domain-containing protein [Cladochytrium replicatum]|nr:chitin synthase-domain-containing protein [Cladochytrium replicatum]